MLCVQLLKIGNIWKPAWKESFDQNKDVKITLKTANCLFKAVFWCFEINSFPVKQQKFAQLPILCANKSTCNYANIG